MSTWSFLGMQPQSIADLAEVAKAHVVQRPGVYVLLTSEAWPYRYPKGESPIFYIGMSDMLCDRVATHRRRVQAILNGKAQGIEWPRYEYAAAHSCRIAAFPLADGVDIDVGDLEDDVIALFARVYGAPPIANGAASRDKVLRRSAVLPPLGLSAGPWLLPSDA